MSGDLNVFKDLKEVSAELEQNLNILEFEVSDATKLLYDLESNIDSKGVSILQEVLKQHTKICEKLEKLFQDEESEVEPLNKELATLKKVINELEKDHEELDQILLEQNLIPPERSILSFNDASNGGEHISNIQMSSSPQPPTSCDSSTFLIPHPPKPIYTPDSVNNEFQSTMCDFGYVNSAKMGRKTFLVKRN